VARAGFAYFLLPSFAHRYVALEYTRKRFLCIAGPHALDLIHHFGLALLSPSLPVVLEAPAGTLAWFDETESIVNSGEADPIELSARWYRLLAALAGFPSILEGSERRVGNHPALESAFKFIEARLGSPIRRCEIATAALLSESHLSKLFAQTYGLSIMVYVENRRLEWAELLLRMSQLSVTDIALRVGFSDPLYFSARFRKKYGLSPRSYRKRGIKA
jgi:AraC-like DNA-binding protein